MSRAVLLSRIPLCALLAFTVIAGCGGDDAMPDASHGDGDGDEDASQADGGDGDGDGGQAGNRDVIEGECEIEDHDALTPYVQRIGCRADFDALASDPLDASIPGARSVKVVLDRLDGDQLYFQNSAEYPIHHEFAFEHLSGDGKPFVPTLSEFNQTEYFSPDRRFVLGSVTYYEGPQVWALELAPYDTASLEMIEQLYRAVADAAYFGPALQFHPTAVAIEMRAAELAGDIAQITTDELFEGIEYQPLNLGVTIGRLRFVEAAALDTTYLSFRDVVVLDHVPNDISVVSGLITEEFQTPLSHVNVLSQNRKTPNMGLRNATTNETLRALEDKWVRLEVGAFEWSIEEATSEEADAFWEANKPDALGVPRIDLEEARLLDIEELVTLEEDGGELPMREAIKEAIPAFGGKAAHYSVLARIPEAHAPTAFAIPIYYYAQFLEQNGFDAQIEDMLADAEFQDDPAVRDARLEELRAAMAVAPVDMELQDLLREKMETEFPETRMRFRSSTNAEDLEGFTGAGLYTSRTGDPSDWEDVLNALREVWASVWFFRAFEERAYRSIDHTAVGMALLVHHSFPEEEANGVALTANPFAADAQGFYVNVQVGEFSVVMPDPGTTTDQFVHYYGMAGQSVVYLSSSNLVPEGEHVLSLSQINALGRGMDAIHKRFSEAYGPAAGNQGWYAMDIEFKFDGPTGEEPELAIKQARPHPGRGQ